MWDLEIPSRMQSSSAVRSNSTVGVLIWWFLRGLVVSNGESSETVICWAGIANIYWILHRGSRGQKVFEIQHDPWSMTQLPHSRVSIFNFKLLLWLIIMKLLASACLESAQHVCRSVLLSFTISLRINSPCKEELYDSNFVQMKHHLSFLECQGPVWRPVVILENAKWRCARGSFSLRQSWSESPNGRRQIWGAKFCTKNLGFLAKVMNEVTKSGTGDPMT